MRTRLRATTADLRTAQGSRKNTEIKIGLLILATQEAEDRTLQVQGQPGQFFFILRCYNKTKKREGPMCVYIYICVLQCLPTMILGFCFENKKQQLGC